MKPTYFALATATLLFPTLTGRTLAQPAPVAPPAAQPVAPTAPATPVTGAPQAPAPIATLFAAMIDALQKNDYLAFVAQGSDAFKAAVTPAILKGVSAQLAPRMKEGYTLNYVTDLKQQGVSQYFWKISFKDGDDEYLISITMRDGKADGFLMR